MHRMEWKPESYDLEMLLKPNYLGRIRLDRIYIFRLIVNADLDSLANGIDVELLPC